MTCKLQIQSGILIFLLVLTDAIAFAGQNITVGVFPRRNASTTIKMFTPLIKYLQSELGIKVKLETAKNFPEFWRRVQSGRYDIVHYNQLHYLLSKNEPGFEVFAKNEEFGVSNISAAIIVRNDGDIHSIADLKGKTILLGGGKLAMVSYVSVKLLLSDKGLKDSDYQSVVAKTPPNALMAMYFGKADAAGVGNAALRNPNIQKKINIDSLSILSIGKSQPHLPWVVASKLDSKLKNSIAEVFLSLNESQKGKNLLKKAGMTGILKSNDEEYNVSRELYTSYKQARKK